MVSEFTVRHGSQGPITVMLGTGSLGKDLLFRGQQKQDGESSSACGECWSGLQARSWKIRGIYMQALNLETSFKCMKVWKWYSVSLKIDGLPNWDVWISRDKADLHEKQLYTFVFRLNAVLFVDGKLLSLVARFYTLWVHRFMMDEKSKSLRYNK